MAGNLSHRNYETGNCEFYVDSIGEIDFLPTTTSRASGNFKGNPNFEITPALGSVCVVGNGGNLLVYILSDSGWVEI